MRRLFAWILCLQMAFPAYAYQSVPEKEENAVEPEDTAYDLGGHWTLKDLMNLVSKATGKQFIYEEKEVAGGEIDFSVNLKIIGPTRLYQMFELVMQGRNYILKTEMGNKIRLEKYDRKHRTEPWRIVEDEDLENLKDSYQMVTRVEEIVNGSPEIIATSLGQLLNTDIERVIGLKGTNVLIISAFAHNVDRISRIIKIMDTKHEKMNMYIVPCRWALAADLSSKINQILNHQSRTDPKVESGIASVPPLLVADERTQNLIVVGLKEHYQSVKDLVDKLDVRVAETPSRFKIYPVANRKASELVTLIVNIYESKKSLQGEQGVKDEKAPRPNVPVTPAVPEGGQPNPNPAPAPTAPGTDSVESIDDVNSDEIPKVVADEDTNTIIALSSSQQVFKELQDIILQLDVKQPQVLIEVSILEIGDDSERQLGFELLDLSSPKKGRYRSFAITSYGNSTVNTVDPFGGRSPLIGSDGALQTGLVAGIFKDSADKIPLLLRAIESNSDSTLVAVPRILTTNNKEATFEVISEEPTTKTDTNNVATTSSFGGYQEAKTELKLTPSISLELIRDSKGNVIKDANGQPMVRKFIRLEINQSVTRFTGESTGGLPPAKQTRKAITSVTIPDENTVVIGGYTSFSDSEAVDRIPFLFEWISRAPLIGDSMFRPFFEALFQKKLKTKSRTNMYMFVTPHIITDMDDLKDIRHRLLDEVDIDKIREDHGLMGQLEKENKKLEKMDKQRDIDERTEEMLEDEERLLNLNAVRWDQEGQEIRRRGEEAGLDADAIEFEVVSTLKCRREMFMLLMALETYHARHEKYPESKEGLDALYRKGPDEMPPILLFRSVDPWGGDYQYGLVEGRPLVRSFGADRRPGGLGIDDDLEMSLQR